MSTKCKFCKREVPQGASYCSLECKKKYTSKEKCFDAKIYKLIGEQTQLEKKLKKVKTKISLLRKHSTQV